MLIDEIFSLIEYLCDEETKVKIASAILRSQDLYEESYNNSIYPAAYSRCANLACREVGLDPFFIRLVSRLSTFAWNEAREWAEEVKTKYERPMKVFIEFMDEVCDTHMS